MGTVEGGLNLTVFKGGLDPELRGKLTVRLHPTRAALDSLSRDAGLVERAANEQDSRDLWLMITHRIARHPEYGYHLRVLEGRDDHDQPPTPPAA